MDILCIFIVIFGRRDRASPGRAHRPPIKKTVPFSLFIYLFIAFPCHIDIDIDRLLFRFFFTK